MSEKKTHKWTPGFDMSTIPYDIVFSRWQSLKALKNLSCGRKRACGHTEWVKSCECCRTNYKRTAYRIARGDKTLADRI